MKHKTQSEVTVNESKQAASLYEGKHTKGEWKVIEPYLGCQRIAVQDEELNVIIAHVLNEEGAFKSKANAQRIVTAVNNYDDMLEGLKAIKARLLSDLDNPLLLKLGPLGDYPVQDVLVILNQVIAKATNSK